MKTKASNKSLLYRTAAVFLVVMLMLAVMPMQTTQAAGGAPTRFYLQNAAASVTPATRGGWDNTASVVTRGMSRTKSGAVTSLAVAETNNNNNYDVLMLKFVSEPIPAQTIAAGTTLTWVIGSLESNGFANDFFHVHAYVVSNDGTTLRGTLLTNNIDTSEWGTTAVGDAPAGAKTLSAVVAQANDRIVIEIGYQAQNNSNNPYTGTLWYGGTGGDLAVGGDETTLTGWFEFSQDLFPLNSTTAGVATATAATSSTINVSMPYVDDGNANNTYTVQYCLNSANCSVSGLWTTWVTGAAHVASPYTTTITGLSPSTNYDVRVTYNDADSVTGMNPQTISNVVTLAPACSGSYTYTAPAGTNRVVVAVVSNEDNNNSPTNVQIGGTAATSISTLTNGNARIFVGYRVIGTSAVPQSMNVTSTNGECSFATTYQNINQTAGTGAANTVNDIATGTAPNGTTTTSTTVDNVAGGQVVYAINMNNGTADGEVPTGTSTAWTFLEIMDKFDGSPGNGNRTAVGQSTTTVAGSATVSVADGAADPHNRSVLVAFALNPVALTATTTMITADNPDASVTGQPVNVAVTVAGGATPTGTVNITGADVNCSIINLVGGMGNCDVTFTSPGVKTLTANYLGDGTHAASSDTESHQVNAASTTTTITNAGALAAASVVGQAVTVNYAVAVTAPGAGTPTGNVTVTDSLSAATCTAPAATGTCNITFTTVGTHNLTATYAGDTNFNGSASTPAIAHPVNAASTTTTITNAGALAAASVVGQAVTVNYAVAVTAPGAGTPTGNVTVTDSLSAATCTAPATTGTCNITFTTVGTHNLTATYAGDTNFNGSASTPAIAHPVNAASTTTTITNASALATASVVGEAVTVNYAVAVTAPGAGTPTGNVTVTDSLSAATCTAPAAAGTCNITFTIVGTHNLTATYAGDTNFNGSASAPATAHPVNAANTTTAITSDNPDPSNVGQAVTVNYAVTVNAPGAGTPTGNVTVSDGVNSCTGTVGAGTCAITLTTVGARTLTATYAGDTNFSGSTSTNAAHQVNNPIPPAITSLAPADGTVNNSVYSHTFTATGSPAPTLSLSGATLPAGLTFDGVDTISGTPTTAGVSGNITVTATNGVNPDDTQTFTITINRANTTTTITNDAPDASAVGQAVTINFTVTGTFGNTPTAPTGNVTVSDGALSCTASVAVGNCSIAFTTPGARTLTATYAGDANFNGSTSAGEPHQVNTSTTTTTIISDAPDPSAGGQAVTVMYTVTVDPPGSGTPTGNVTVSDGVDSCIASVAAGQCDITLTTDGTRTLTAIYAGNTNFGGSTSADEPHVVDAIAPTVSSIDRADGDPTNATSVDFTVTFSKPVTGGGVSNFILVPTGVTGPSITGISGTGTTRTVTVNTGTGDGTIGLNLANSSGIADLVGNALGTSSFTGQVYTIQKSGPTVNIGAPSIPGTTIGPVDFPITVTGATTVNLTNGDVTLNTTGTAIGTINVTNGTTNNPIVTISGISGNGTLGISIAAGIASDSAVPDPNTSLAAGPSVTFIVDTTGPLVTANGINTVIDTGDGVLTEYEVVTIGITKFTVTFNEAVLNVGSSDPRYGDSVINPANYMLIRDLGDTADFQTASCHSGAVTPADTKIDITAVTYDTSTHVATFTVNGNLPLSNGSYRLYVCGTTSITNLAGIELAGNGTTAGTDFIRNFIVSIGGGRGGNNKGGHAKKNDTNDTISGLPIPVTGFAPDQVTLLPHQPAEKAYKPLDEIRIEIPTLGINFPIVGVSFIGNNWDLTWLKNSVGYLEGSAYPTFSGNTVLTAHVIDANNNLGPFSDIKGMRLGDRIYLHAYGQVYVYQVQENRKLLPANITTVFKHEEYEWVTLVTCEDYNTKTKTYDYRRMVRAVLVSVIPKK